MPEKIIPSAVRLEPEKERSDWCRNVFAPTANGGSHSGDTSSEGEGGGFGGSFAGGKCYRITLSVESATQIVDDLGGDVGNIRWEGLSQPDLANLMARLIRVRLYDLFVSIELPEIVNFPLKVEKTFFSPCNLLFRAFKCVRHDTLTPLWNRNYPHFRRIPTAQQVPYFPQPVGHFGCHRRRHAERSVNLNEVVGKVIERHGCGVITELARKPIRQAGVASHLGAHRPVLALHVAGRDVLWVGIADHVPHFDTDDLRRGIAGFVFQHRAVDFLQYRVIHFAAKGSLNGFDVGPMAVSRNLYAIHQAGALKIAETISFCKASGSSETLRTALHFGRRN